MTEEILSEEQQVYNKRLEEAAGIVRQLKELLEKASSDAASVNEIRERVDSDRKVIVSTLGICKEVPELADAAAKANETAETELEKLRACVADALASFSKVQGFSSDAEQAVAHLEHHVQVGEKADARVAELETELQKLSESCEIQLGTIENLLPGATSAGLASAFSDRSETFRTPEKQWHKWFIGSLIALIVLAVQGVYATSTTSILTYDEVIRLWLSRLPIAAALVWLALHASREAALAKRVEEDYGYKAAIASSLEGFRKMLLDINSEARDQTVLGRLCSDTLATISAPPGRIYDKHKLTETPIDKISDTVSAVSNAIPSRLGGKAKEVDAGTV